MNLKLKFYWWYYPVPKLAVGYIPDINVEDNIKHDLGNQIATERGDFTIPPNIQDKLKIIQSELVTFMEAPKAVNTGFEEVIPTQEVFDFRTLEDKPGKIRFQYREIILPPQGIKTKSIELDVGQLSQVTRDALESVNQFAYLLAVKDYVSRHGKTEEQVKQIIGEKQKVFISYRGRIREFATRIYDELKSYARGVFFAPFIDYIDLGPGIWLENLEKRLADLAEGDAFLPVLTQDYFAGPVSKLEYSKAISRAHGRGVTIIPILYEGDIEDYKDRFISEFNMITIRSMADPKKYKDGVDKLASWVISKKPSS